MKTKTLFVTMMLLIVLPSIALEAQDKKEWISPEAAAKVVDFQLQGEYLGTFKDESGTEISGGLQLIALGGGKFRGVSYLGGLPGAGWQRGDKSESKDGNLNEQGQIVFKIEDGEVTATLKDGKLTITADGESIEMKKVARKSPTMGKAAPKGAIVLFDGTKDAAKNNFQRGQIVMENLLRHDVETNAKFGDHQLHLEFRLPFMPYARGQGRGNSGMYVQGRYECQILDSFGLDGANNECGGIYQIAKPNVNMCLPPLVWQTYDVDFTAARYDDAGKKVKNARVTISHNGVKIHDDLELPNGTPGKHPEGPGPDILYLQGHGNPVVFRNIWVVNK
ncbi:MAG: DUF1080 domain-containing protein [Planctomycetaceae bacterium]|jgi:hypothetical protein|nr:DUF1080 domain-containing protein [Planctomycetaceae bacterium]MBT4844847.1 DUF1080 domain-containing protein [Planctomycetaceae bacterium]MBT5125552.1 DUF1080 domain-containing protein [Planctomycetaceae bacterium]MBT5600009.1 DUF1080 domain-containing protein [Planctomycetaceae bacterium]MBT7254481.1 DUF1080 domain-containing protein [Planctomycetaceae bacterium]